MNRPEKVTKFLNHMFPTESDKIIFEAVYNQTSNLNRLYRNYYKFELSMPTNEFYIKLSSITRRLIYCIDSNTASEIHDSISSYDGGVIVDMTNSTKSQTKQLEFINRVCGAIYKTSSAYRSKHKHFSRFKNVGSNKASRT